ncbi:adhesion G protein-coupled receptor A3-like isoform X2 [Physella acuta]|uniref:adhesion G protein-coupled receptor A3-like isoform X2 n=1 Tax=Physella acuta TaxID=109671 RepID=UPI0027DDDDBC|nr:adhesion G protein-coupled receptor A3-like isoform X2 [Physella acuta]
MTCTGHTGSVRHLALLIMLLAACRPLDAVSDNRSVKASRSRLACDLSSGTPRPQECHCSNDEVTCSGLPTPLLRVPSNLGSWVRTLDLSSNKLTFIDANNFVAMESLQKLYLNDNHIFQIHPAAFRNLYRLQELNLTGNLLMRMGLNNFNIQHLSSLKIVDLSNNQISFINKFTFLTAVSTFHLDVDFRNNPVECNCDVLAIRNWRSNMSARFKVSLRNLLCANDEQHRSYDQVARRVFGSCTAFERVRRRDTAVDRVRRHDASATGHDYTNANVAEQVETQNYANDVNVFSQERLTCGACRNVSTNFACKQSGHVLCTSNQTMCYTQLSWDQQVKVMSISGGCQTFESCLVMEATNAEHCSVGHSLNVQCHFCCRGPTCSSDTIGGRTRDDEFLVTFIKQDSPLQPALTVKDSDTFRLEQARYAAAVKSLLTDVSGGLDVFTLRYDNISTNSYRVVLELRVTSLSIFSREDIEHAIQLGIASNRSLAFYKQENIDSNSVYLSSAVSDLKTCPQSTSSSGQWSLHWEEAMAGETKYNSVGDKNCFSRHCLLVDGVTKWGQVVSVECQVMSTTSHTSAPVTSVSPVAVTSPLDMATSPLDMATSVKSLSIDLLNDITATENFSPAVLHGFILRLEELSTESSLAVADVPDTVMTCISRLLDISHQLLQTSEREFSTSHRLLAVIEHLPERAPLTAGRLHLVKSNLAVAGIALHAGETRNLQMSLGQSGSWDEQVQIALDYSNDSQQWTDQQSSVVIPTEAVVSSLSPDQKAQLSRVTYVVHQTDKLFSTLETAIETPSESGSNRTMVNLQVNSYVISASILHVHISDLQETVNITFRHVHTNASLPRCVYWRQSTNGSLRNWSRDGWSRDGCDVLLATETVTTCGCNHLTNFALLMDVYMSGDSVSSMDGTVLSYISYIGCGLSLVALIFTLLTYTIFSKLRGDNPSKILFNLCLALTLSNGLFLVGMRDYTFHNTLACKVVAASLHYFLLASLTWMAVEAFYMYVALIRIFNTYFSHFLLKCCLVGWGLPFVIVAATLGVNKTDNYALIASGICWLRTEAFYGAFVGPVCLILVINCLAFLMVLHKLATMSKATSKLKRTDKNRTVQQLRAAIGVLILLGLTWLFAIFAVGQASTVFHYLFAIFNSFQGLFIFLFYCMFKKEAVKAWKSCCPCFSDYYSHSRTSTTSRDLALSRRKSTRPSLSTLDTSIFSSSVRPKQAQTTDVLTTDIQTTDVQTTETTDVQTTETTDVQSTETTDVQTTDVQTTNVHITHKRVSFS